MKRTILPGLMIWVMLGGSAAAEEGTTPPLLLDFTISPTVFDTELGDVVPGFCATARDELSGLTYVAVSATCAERKPGASGDATSELAHVATDAIAEVFDAPTDATDGAPEPDGVGTVAEADAPASCRGDDLGCVSLYVPDGCPTIQAAIDAALDCDTVVVRWGTYREHLLFPVKAITVMSDASGGGDELVDYDGIFQNKYGNDVEVHARRKVLRRALETVLDGSGSPGGTDASPLVDFEVGVSRDTVFDGFTVQYLPSVDHTLPGHAHTIECRGSAATIRNNIVRFNGSTGIGSHATFLAKDPDGSVQDFRQSNVESIAEPLVENNVVHHNEGMGLGNNHYSRATMRDNEVFGNAALEPDHSAAGIGARHGARPTIERNVVYGNAWGGITVHQGVLQGQYPIDLRTSAVIRDNEVFDNGAPDAPIENVVGIGVDSAGTPDEPVVVEGNVSYDSHTAGIGIRNTMAGEAYVGTDVHVTIASNTVYGAAQAGISCGGGPIGMTHCEIARNVVYDNAMVGIAFGGTEYPDNATGLAHHNTVVGNGAVGLSSGATPVDIRNNIFCQNVGPGLLHPSGPHGYNLVSGNNGQALDCGGQPWCVNPQYAILQGGQRAGTGDKWTDPRFVDTLGADFRLTAGSPAIDAGVVLEEIYEGTAPDMGAFEFQPGVCGNGSEDAGEECDDGNTAGGDGCSSACRWEGQCTDPVTCSPPCDEDADCTPSCGACERCGNERVDPGEQCDDGNRTDGDGCSAECQLEGDYRKCQEGASLALGKFFKDKAKCIRRCKKGARTGRNPVSDCAPPYAGKTAECVAKAETKASEKIERKCANVCPGCYAGGDCAAFADAEISTFEAAVDALVPDVYCAESEPTSTEAKCQDTVMLKLGKFAADKLLCLRKCRKGERKGKTAPGSCDPPPTNTRASDCIDKKETKAATLIDKKCGPLGGQAPACHGGQTGAGWAALIHAIVDAADPRLYCGSGSGGTRLPQ